MNCIVIHYGEIALKGNNRCFFEKTLAENIRSLTGLNPIIEHGRIIINAGGNEKTKSILSKIPGISWFAFCIKCDRSIDSIKKCVIENYKGKGTVKVDTTRSDKSFTMTSMEMNRFLGSVLEKHNHKISMNPENKIYIEITKKDAVVFFEKHKGIAGLPVGSSGKVLVLLSGGIDSPVAAYLMARRGCVCTFIHFHSFSGSEEVKNSKMVEILKQLSEYCSVKECFIVPYDEFQVSSINLEENQQMIMFRRFMFLFAERLAKKIGAAAIVTGDNIGQVASQTLENMNAVDFGLSISVIRPLAGLDKNEIIDFAKRIGTYDLSIKQYKDCCSIVAKHPEIKSSNNAVKSNEEKINIDKIIDESMKRMEIIKF